MTYEYPVLLLEAVYGLVRKRVKPCSSESPNGSREHTTLGGISCIVEIQKGVRVKDMIMRVGQLVIPLLRDLQAGEDCHFLDYKG